MIMYSPRKGFGSVEQCLREMEMLTLVLTDPEHSRQLFDQFPVDKLMSGIADAPPHAGETVTVCDTDEKGNLRIYAYEKEEGEP